MITSRIRRFAKIFFIVFINLIVLEIILRTFGFIYSYSQSRQNSEADVNPNKSINIVAMGESTTAITYYGSWTEKLQQLFDLESIPVKIINKGVPGTVTALIVSDAEEIIKHEKPRIVITMMGINDYSPLSYNKIHSNKLIEFLLNMRVVKLSSALLRQSSLFVNEVAKKEPIEPQYGGLPKNLLKSAQIADYAEVKRQLDIYLKDKNEFQKASIFVTLMFELYSNGKHKGALRTKDYLILKKTLKFAHRYQNIPELLVFAAMAHKDPDICKQVLTATVAENIRMSDHLLTRFAECLSNDVVFADILRSQRSDLGINNSGIKVTGDNYRHFYDIIEKYKICWIVMQYPLLNVEELKKYFTAE